VTRPNPEQIAEWKRLAETSGVAPWTASRQEGSPGHCTLAQVFDASGISVAVLDAVEPHEVASIRAAFIAAARIAVPAMIEAYEDAEERAHYANGTAELAIRQREELVAGLKAARNELQKMDADFVREAEAHADTKAESSRLRERVRELEEALKPFAATALRYDVDVQRGVVKLGNDVVEPEYPGMSNFRRARSLLDKTEGKS
jgi:hypothetical protein